MYEHCPTGPPIKPAKQTHFPVFVFNAGNILFNFPKIPLYPRTNNHANRSLNPAKTKGRRNITPTL